jgi:hypothetical protein
MEVVILSEYMNNISTDLSPINVNQSVSNSKFEVGNLVIKEYFKKENDETFSYTKETMIVVEVIDNGINDLSVTIKPVIKLIISPKGTVAIVNNYDETLYYIDEKWRNEDTLDSEKICDNLVLITPQEAVYKTTISKDYMFEEDGKIVHAKKVDMSKFKPLWCHVN